MKKKKLRLGEGFRVVRGKHASQAAEMVLAPGDAEGGATGFPREILSSSGDARSTR